MRNRVTMNMRWMVWLLCGMGALFLGIGIFVGLAAPGFENLSPEEAKIFTTAFLGAFGIPGVIMIAVGYIIGSRAGKRERLRQWLIQDGNYVWADIMDVSPNHVVRINGRHPYVLRCKYRHSDGETYIFKSQYLRYDPSSMFPDGRIKVWFDRDNIKNYYVDVDDNATSGYIEL